MTLSDEDYGILLNDIERGVASLDTAEICYLYKHPEDLVSREDYIGEDFWLQLAMLIILSEGRELP